MNKRDEYLTNQPESDDNDEIQTNSIKALNSFLPTDKLHFRDERIDDKGVDGSLEVKEKGVFTNCRTQVQLKGTRFLKPTKGGWYSLQVETKNLNHLLNNPISIYILYVEPKNEFRFVWAWDEFKKRAEKNPDWLKKGKITLRFSEILDKEKLDEIRERIIAQSVGYRVLNEKVFLAKPSNIIVEIDPNTFDINDSEKIKDFILSKGTLYISTGYAEQVLEKIGLLKPEDRKNQSVQIIKAIAEFEKGLYQRAKETLTILESNNPNLSEEDILIKTFIKLHCNHETGKIELNELVEGLKELAPYRNKKIPYHFRLSYLSNAIIIETNLGHRRKLLDELKVEIEKDINKESVNEIDLRNRFIYLDREGQQIVLEFSYEIGQLLLRKNQGFSSNLDSAFVRHNQVMNDWENKLNEVASLSKNITTFADVVCLKATIIILRQPTLLLLSKYYHPIYGMIPSETIDRMRGDLATAIKTYSENELIGHQLKAKSLLSQILLFVGQDKEASEMNSGISDLADDMNYAKIKAEANNPFPKDVKETFNETEDSDERRARLDDETINLYSQQQIDALKIPQDRLDNIKKSYCFIRDKAIERLNWCENLELMEDSRHTWNLSTYYSINPNRYAICIKHQYESSFENPDWKLIASTFKKDYCENCPDRKPKKY